jgi:hypothetical protein
MAMLFLNVYIGRQGNGPTNDRHYFIAIQCPMVWIDRNQGMLFISSDEM